MGYVSVCKLALVVKTINTHNFRKNCMYAVVGRMQTLFITASICVLKLGLIFKTEKILSIFRTTSSKYFSMYIFKML